MLDGLNFHLMRRELSLSLFDGSLKSSNGVCCYGVLENSECQGEKYFLTFPNFTFLVFWNNVRSFIRFLLQGNSPEMFIDIKLKYLIGSSQYTGCPNKNAPVAYCYSELLVHFFWDTL